MSGEHHLFAGVPVADLATAVEFYERLLGRPPELVPNERETAWQLHPGAWIVLIADPGAAGSARHTLIVEDLAGFLAGAGDRGVTAGSEHDVGPDMRQSVIADPDGNRLKVAARRR